MVEELEHIARERHSTKSELFREMLRVFRSYHKRYPEPEISDEWVMQAIREAQEEQKQNPMTPEQLVAEFKELARYGSQQAKKVGINVADDAVVNRIIHEERARRRERQKNGA